jgi:hypothetical protein
VPPKYFVNMDQAAVYFEMKSKTTIDRKGASTMSCCDSGSNSRQCSVVIAVAADGTKLPPILFFKGKPGARVEKQLAEDGWLACVQEKGWFDRRSGAIWVEKVFKPYVIDAEESFLLIDHFSIHFMKEFVNR